jgi:hypothetical protein
MCNRNVHSRQLLTFIFGAADTTITQKIDANGFIKALAVQTPNFTNDVTAILTILDPLVPLTGESVTLYTGSAIARNTKDPITGADITAAERGDIPVDDKYTATITLSGVPGGTGGTVLVLLYLKH